MPGRGSYELSGTLQLMSDGEMISAKSEGGTLSNQGYISGMDTVHEDIMLTDYHNNTVSIYRSDGSAIFNKKFDHNVWDCAHLRRGTFALLSDDSIKLFTHDWEYYGKIRVGLHQPRQLVVDSDDFFVVADALCEDVAVYHAKSGQLVSEFSTANFLSTPASPSPKTRCVFTIGGQPDMDNIYAAGTGITINSQDLIYIAGRTSSTVHVFSHYGAKRVDLQPPKDVARMLAKPVAMCFDSRDNIFLADAGTNEVVWFSADWSESEVVLSERDGLSTPISIALTDNGQLVVADKSSKIFWLSSRCH